jgi:hypothetical protein
MVNMEDRYFSLPRDGRNGGRHSYASLPIAGHGDNPLRLLGNSLNGPSQFGFLLASLAPLQLAFASAGVLLGLGWIAIFFALEPETVPIHRGLL